MNKGLAFFSKVPLPGRTKSRLQGSLTAQDCALFHRACLVDLHRLVLGRGEQAYLFYTGGEQSDFFRVFPGKTPADFAELEKLELPAFQFYPQEGADLGERMYNAAQQVIAARGQVILLGTDLPDLTPEEMSLCLKEMEQHDVTIGPAEDGGYYLLGLKSAYPFLFQNIDWSTERVREQTAAAARQNDLSISILRPRRDVDTCEDLQELVKRADETKNNGLLSYRLAKRLLDKLDKFA